MTSGIGLMIGPGNYDCRSELIIPDNVVMTCSFLIEND